MACCVKLRIPDELSHRLDAIYQPALDTARAMLKRRNDTSSKHWKSVPCVVAKSLSAKYQRNIKCNAIRRLTIPICGDKGRQVKLEHGGVRVPAVFGKTMLPFAPLRSVIGHIRQIEFFRRNGHWFASVCHNTPCSPQMQIKGCIGVDRNSVGNIAAAADPKSGKVRFIGFNADRWKHNFRCRRARIMSQGKKRLASRLRRKQSRRTHHENHRAAKTIVAFAAEHCSAIALEELKLTKGAKHYADKRQWAHAQLEKFVRYKAALRGVPVVFVNPAFTSQDCSRCGSRNKPNGKSYSCSYCGHKTHRDANASFNIARRGWQSICGNGNSPNVLLPGRIDVALSGTRGAK